MVRWPFPYATQVSTPEVGRLGESDESQLIWAAIERRAFVTFNVGHFASLHSAWLQTGRHHAGLIVSSQRPVGDLVKRLLKLAAMLEPADMDDRIEFLSNW